MNKADKSIAERLAVSMGTWTKKEWKAFNQKFASHETICSQHEVNKAAYKSYMLATGLVSTQYTIADTEHYATLTEKMGQSYVDYSAMLEELADKGIDTKALIRKYTKRRASSQAFSFK